MRRKFCFEVNAARIAGLGRLYLWTFTTKEAEACVDVRVMWNRLLTYLRRKLPLWAGIRVYEMHGGKWGDDNLSHGLHVHVLCNAFHDVNLVRDAARAAGWGRIHVARIKANRWAYVAKYLFKPRCEALKGWRLWSCFNMPERSRMRDIMLDTVRGRLFSYGFVKYGREWRGLRWNEKLAAVAQWQRESCEGRPLSRPVALCNRCPNYSQADRRPGWRALFDFVGMGKKQGFFDFAAGATARDVSGLGVAVKPGCQPLTRFSGSIFRRPARGGGFLSITKLLPVVPAFNA